MDVALDWLSLCPRLLVVHYENFLEDRVRELGKIHRFLNFPADEKRLKCIALHESQTFRRKHKNKVPSDAFSSDLIEEVDRGIMRVQKVLRRRGLEPMPLEKVAFSGLEKEATLDCDLGGEGGGGENERGEL